RLRGGPVRVYLFRDRLPAPIRRGPQREPGPCEPLAHPGAGRRVALVLADRGGPGTPVVAGAPGYGAVCGHDAAAGSHGLRLLPGLDAPFWLNLAGRVAPLRV